MKEDIKKESIIDVLVKNIESRIEALEEFHLGSDDDWDIEHLRAYKETIDVIHEEVSKFHDGWIPFNPDDEDTHPKTDEYIYISLSNFTIPIIGRYETDKEGGAFYCGDETETLSSQGMIVNAWMPLISSYREKTDD